MTDKPKRRIVFHAPYVIMLAVYILFIIAAFILEKPADLFKGFYGILTSPSLLITDYIHVGGLGATLLNVAIVGTASVLMLLLSGIKPSGATIMAMWMTTGFAFFGKNVFNMIPLTCGVWIFSRYNKEPFTNYSLAALLVATLSPAVSEISFMGIWSRPVEIFFGILFGFLVGFLFPAISSSSARSHMGYNLYNMGFAAGLMCIVLVPLLNRFDLIVPSYNLISTGNNFILGIGLYGISLALIIYSLYTVNLKESWKRLKQIHKSSGRLVSDFYFETGNSVYLNMGILCIFSTSLVLAVGAGLNGPTISGILTIMAFGSFGKHMYNIFPIIFGSTFCIWINGWDITEPGYILAVLFSTGLAPIAGQFGWHWGMIAGFLHVFIVTHTGYLSGGINLYSNGFAAGFVVMFLLPIIMAFKREKVK